MNHHNPSLENIHQSRLPHGTYGRLFQHLSPLEPVGETTLEKENWIRKIIKREFKRDEISAGDDPHENQEIAAGYTYLGQFIAHDLSFDPLPIGARQSDPDRVTTFRTPGLDLDCLYGRGPELDGYLYRDWDQDSNGSPRWEGSRTLREYAFPEGVAVQKLEARNPGERDLPRRETPIVIVSSEGVTFGLKQQSGRQWLKGRLEKSWSDVLKKGAKEKIVHELDRIQFCSSHRIQVHPSQVREQWIGKRCFHVVPLKDGSKVLARPAGNEKESFDWYTIAESRIDRMGVACIADSRNDSHTIIAQFHLAMARFHNRVLLSVSEKNPTRNPRWVFEEARRLVRWHYQWIVVHDFLKTLVGKSGERHLMDAIEDAKVGRHNSRFQWRNQRYVPIEFAAAAFRLGHLMSRTEYDLNEVHRSIPLFSQKDEDDLRGGRVMPSGWTLQWNRFFGPGAQKSRLINFRMAESLEQVPLPDQSPISVIELDVLRGWKLGLPSGQAVAKSLGLDPVPLTVPKNGSKEDESVEEDPLMVYLIREAIEMSQGKALGPVGANIIVQTIVGLIHGDPSSYLSRQPEWSPAKDILFSTDKIDFLDIVRFAELPTTRGEWNKYMLIQVDTGEFGGDPPGGAVGVGGA